MIRAAGLKEVTFTGKAQEAEWSVNIINTVKATVMKTHKLVPEAFL